jgi:hypothetical protein
MIGNFLSNGIAYKEIYRTTDQQKETTRKLEISFFKGDIKSDIFVNACHPLSMDN